MTATFWDRSWSLGLPNGEGCSVVGGADIVECLPRENKGLYDASARRHPVRSPEAFAGFTCLSLTAWVVKERLSPASAEIKQSWEDGR